jgi:cytochrome d ubiquinol oxidase subunit I
MDAILLSRIQFGVAAGFHFIFPPLSLGISLFILIFETLYLRFNNDLHKTISSFLIKILGVIFVLGVATGIVLEFSFGTNWAQYSRLVGDIFGVPLAAEGIFSFFLESVFLGLLVFGREKVSKKTFWLAAFLVFFGAHLSGLWIIIANSWMQTPAGYTVDNGRALLTDFTAAVFNPSMLNRFFHVIIAAWITGSLFLAGIGSWYLIKNRYENFAKNLLKAALIVFIATAVLQFGSGHASAVIVARTQPEKLAAFEALWQSTEGAPLALFGIPIESEQKTYINIAVPKLLSLMVDFDPNSKIAGLNEFSPQERPPVLVPFVSYHIMIVLGSLFLFLALLGSFLLMKKTIYTTKWFLSILILTSPLPILANEFGWIAAEVGRQPWAVYKILKTADAVSVVVPAWQVLFSLIMFSLIFLLLLVFFIYILMKIINKGPDSASGGY